MQIPKPLTPEVKELFERMMFYAQTGNLGLISALDKQTLETRFTLFGRHIHDDGSYTLVPLGFLSNTAGDEVIEPGTEVPEFTLRPDLWADFVAYRGNAPDEVDRWADDGGAV